MARLFLASLAVLGLFAVSSSAGYVRWHQLDVAQQTGQSIAEAQDGSRQVTSLYEVALYTPEKIAELQYRRSAAAHDALRVESSMDQLVTGLGEGLGADSSDLALPCGPHCTECNDATGDCLVCQDTALLIIDPPSSPTPRVHCRLLTQLNCAPGAHSDVFGCSACPGGFGMSATGPPFACDVACPANCLDCDNVLRLADSDDEGMCNVCAEGYDLTGSGYCEPVAGWTSAAAALGEAVLALVLPGCGGTSSSGRVPAAELRKPPMQQVFSVGGAAANAGTQRAAGAQLPDQALGAAARQGHSTLVTYGGVGGATGGTVLTRTAWWAAGGGLAALPGPQGSLLISLVSPAEPMAQQGLDAPGAFKVASSSEDAHALPSAGRQRHSAADAIQAAARSDPWWEGSHLAKGLAQRLNRLSVTMPAYEQALEQRGSGTPEDASGSFPEASGQLQEATLQAARELAAATGLSPAAALDKAASAVLQSLGQGTTHAAEALPTADASVAPPADGSAAVPPQPLPDQVGGWLARAQALVSRALAAILGGEGSSKPDQDIAAEVPPVDGLVSAVDKPSIPGSASALAGGLFPVEPSLVSDMWPLEAPLDSRQQGSLAPSAASTANRKNNAAAVLAAGVPALAPAPQ